MMSAARSAAWATSGAALARGRRAVRAGDRDRSEQLPAGAERHGQRPVVELDQRRGRRRAPGAARARRRRPSRARRRRPPRRPGRPPGRPPRGRRAPRAGGGTAPARARRATIASSAVGDRRDAREAPGERLGLVARRALGGRALDRRLGGAAGTEVLDLEQDRAHVAVGVADGRADGGDRHLVPVGGGEAQLAGVGVAGGEHPLAEPDERRPVLAMEARGEIRADRRRVGPTTAPNAGFDRTIRPSSSTSTMPVGEDSHARRRSSSARSRPRRWRSSSANTATLERSTTGSNGLST